MKTKLILLLCYISICSECLHANAVGEDSLLYILEETIRTRAQYLTEKENKLGQIKQRLSTRLSAQKRYDILDELLGEYRSYNADTALSIAQQRLQLAYRMDNKALEDNARMNIAEVMGIAGMYKEAIEQMGLVNIDSLPDNLHTYYYQILRTLYDWLGDYVVVGKEKERYKQLMSCYTDTLARRYAASKDTLSYVLSMSQHYNTNGQYDKAIELMSRYYRKNENDHRYIAIGAYTLAESYKRLGDAKNEKKYLAIASIADLKAPVLEYAALPDLAVLLFKEGEVNRAYSYLKVCMEDAVACNARLRILDILEIFPIVNDAYQKQLKQQQQKMAWALISISLLSFFLLAAIFYVYKQMKRVVEARREVIKANKQLKELNEELHQSNEKLKEASRSIAENSHLKEEYIGRYMDWCSVYLEKMDSYRRHLGKIASTGNLEELYKNLKSSKFIEKELADFYANFDTTFLQLFPTFVEDFNKLLAPNEQITPKSNERLNTELRIFALIRLGITDSVKIAQFLRYSVTTIYNYRVKVRNKAAGDRNLLEQKVMEIGR